MEFLLITVKPSGDTYNKYIVLVNVMLTKLISSVTTVTALIVVAAAFGGAETI
jgi:hypothetical protein